MRNLFVSTLVASSLFSATFNVDSTSQLRQALEDAALNGENDTIILAPGRYKVMDDEVGTFTFNDNEEYNLTIIGAVGYSRDEIILDGEGKRQVLNLQNSKPFTVILKHLTIMNGKARYGGGIYTSGDIIVEDCNISKNSVGGDYDSGGGIYSESNIVVKNSIISHNSAGYKGGGFYTDRDAVVTNSTLSYNSAEYGGGFSSNNAVVTNSRFSNNVISILEMIQNFFITILTTSIFMKMDM